MVCLLNVLTAERLLTRHVTHQILYITMKEAPTQVVKESTHKVFLCCVVGSGHCNSGLGSFLMV
jgi:hypothetical protein